MIAPLISDFYRLIFAFLVTVGAANMTPSEIEAQGNCDGYIPMAELFGLPGRDASRVMFRESRCDPTAINPRDVNGGSYGLMQINAIHIKDVEKRPWLWEGVGECLVEDTDDLLVGWKNLCFGSYLYRKSGWAPWAWFDG